MAKPVNNLKSLKTFVSGGWLSKQMSLKQTNHEINNAMN